jgi:hypothetical protein
MKISEAAKKAALAIDDAYEPAYQEQADIEKIIQQAIDAEKEEWHKEIIKYSSRCAKLEALVEEAYWEGSHEPHACFNMSESQRKLKEIANG